MPIVRKTCQAYFLRVHRCGPSAKHCMIPKRCMFVDLWQGAAGCCCVIAREMRPDAQTPPKLQPDTTMPLRVSRRSRIMHCDSVSRKQPVQDLRIDGERKPLMTRHRARAFLSELMILAEALRCNRFRTSDLHELLCRFGFDGDNRGAVLAIRSLTDHLRVPQAYMVRIAQVFLAAQTY